MYFSFQQNFHTRIIRRHRRLHPPGYHASQQLAAQVYETTGYRLATLPEEMGMGDDGRMGWNLKHPIL